MPKEKTVKYDFWGRGWKVSDKEGKRLVAEYDDLPKWAQKDLSESKARGEWVPYTWINKLSSGAIVGELPTALCFADYIGQHLGPVLAAFSIPFVIDVIAGNAAIKRHKRYVDVPYEPLPKPEEEAPECKKETGYLALRSDDLEQSDPTEYFIVPKPHTGPIEVVTVSPAGTGTYSKFSSD